jgi:hypothetical protein
MPPCILLSRKSGGSAFSRWSVVTKETFECNLFLPSVSVVTEVFIYDIGVRGCRA